MLDKAMTTESKIREMLKECLDLKIDVQTIQREDNLLLFGMNSLNCMKLIVMIENEYEIEVEDEDLTIANFQTIDKIISYIQNLEAKQMRQ